MSREAARQVWAEFKEELAYRPTRENFRSAWRTACGWNPSETVVELWWSNARRLAKNAGLTLHDDGSAEADFADGWH